MLDQCHLYAAVVCGVLDWKDGVPRCKETESDPVGCLWRSIQFKREPFDLCSDWCRQDQCSHAGCAAWTEAAHSSGRHKDRRV